MATVTHPLNLFAMFLLISGKQYILPFIPDCLTSYLTVHGQHQSPANRKSGIIEQNPRQLSYDADPSDPKFNSGTLELL
jgi:hypothetical protein